MLTHDRPLSGAIDISWQRPVLPDRGPASSPVDSPLSRRLLNDLQLASGERLLTSEVGDPQLIECAADLVGPGGRVACVEHRVDRFRLVERRMGSHDRVTLLPELPNSHHDRYDAIAVVVRDRTVPDQTMLRELARRLEDDGRLALIGFEEPTGRIAASGLLRPSRRRPPTRNASSRMDSLPATIG